MKLILQYSGFFCSCSDGKQDLKHDPIFKKINYVFAKVQSMMLNKVFTPEIEISVFHPQWQPCLVSPSLLHAILTPGLSVNGGRGPSWRQTVSGKSRRAPWPARANPTHRKNGTPHFGLAIAAPPMGPGPWRHFVPPSSTGSKRPRNSALSLAILWRERGAIFGWVSCRPATIRAMELLMTLRCAQSLCGVAIKVATGIVRSLLSIDMIRRRTSWWFTLCGAFPTAATFFWMISSTFTGIVSLLLSKQNVNVNVTFVGCFTFTVKRIPMLFHFLKERNHSRFRQLLERLSWKEHTLHAKTWSKKHQCRLIETVLSRGVRSLLEPTRKSSPWGNFSDGGIKSINQA